MDSVRTEAVNNLDPVENRTATLTRENDQKSGFDVSRRFEALLLFTMIKTMRSSLAGDSLIGSEQQNLYFEMWDREIAEAIADSGGLGLGKMVDRQLSSDGAMGYQESSTYDALSANRQPAINALQSPLNNLELINRYRAQVLPNHG